MKNQRKSAKQQVEEFPVWTFSQAERAVPYITSIMRSIRDHFLESQSLRHKARHLEAKPGRPNRSSIIQHEEAKREADKLQDMVAEAARELAGLNVHCVDPVNGIAMIPFVQSQQLAWLIFDLFADVKIQTWRFHNDPLTTRRPLSEMEINPMPASIGV